MNRTFWLDTAAALAGVGFGFFLATVYVPNPTPDKECSLYKVAQKPVTSYVLKPVVQKEKCTPPDPVVVKEKCEEPAVEKQEEPAPRKRHRRRWWRR